MEPQQFGTCTVLTNSQGRILFGKRKNAYKSGFYGLPGGRIEVNELLIQAARREVLEETNLDVPNIEYVGVIRENQGEYDFIHFVFKAEVDDQQPRLCEPEKCEGWEWFSIEQFSKFESRILPGHVAAVTCYTKNSNLIDIVR